jgi:uncharacterized protein
MIDLPRSTNVPCVDQDRRPHRGPRLAHLSFVLLALTASCASYGSKIERFSSAWNAGDYDSADAAIDGLISKASGVPSEVVHDSRGLSEAIDPREGDTALYLLEKAMTQLALGDFDACIDLLRRSRDTLDPRHVNRDASAFIGTVALDDGFADYVGADYEHIVLRSMLAIADLLNGGDDAFAYAIQIDEKQEQILGSDFGAELSEDENAVTYSPQEQYQRVAIGAYLLGLVQETKFMTDEGAKAYERALEWSGGVGVVQDAYDEMSGASRIEQGTGLVHIIYLGGSGPVLVEGASPVSDLALALASIALVVLENEAGPLAQTQVRVPVVAVQDSFVPPITLRVGDRTVTTETLLDVNTVAQQQSDANMPWIVARAVLRRAFKAGVSKIAANQFDDRGAGELVNLLGNLLLTAAERADTRSWRALPAEIQIARVRLPEGEYVFELGGSASTGIRVRSGRTTHVVVLRPNLAAPATLLVDVYSRVQDAGDVPVTEAPAAAPAP